MTITGMAKQLHTSTMTIYRRLKRAGVNVDDLRDDAGELTASGVSVIASMFDATGAQHDATDNTTRMQQDAHGGATGATTATTAAQAGQVDTAAAVQIATLTAQVDGLRALVATLEGERDDLRRQLDAVTAALHAEQTDRANERRLLTAGDAGTGEGPRRRGFFDFLRRKT